jgi:hypothetical protein
MLFDMPHAFEGGQRNTGGCERTEAEYRSLYRAAGFELTKTILTKSPTRTTVIEGRPM